MPLSVTCQCGARLEIDDKFLGKEVPCPDCNRPLPTTPVAAPPVVAAPPPLDLPDYRRTSGLAVLSLALALVGMFTIVGTIAAIVVGVLAVKEISARPTRLEGLSYARAGIVVGIVGTFLTLIALASPTVFGLDAFLRELAFAGRIRWDSKDVIESTRGQEVSIEMKRPSADWGAYVPPNNQPNNLEPDDIIMINPRDDAYIALFSFDAERGENDDDRQKKVLERFYRCELVSILGRLQGKPLDGTGTVVGTESVNNDTKKEVTLDLRLAGVDRRFLIQYRAKDVPVSVLVGSARVNNFDRLRDVFRKTFDTKKP